MKEPEYTHEIKARRPVQLLGHDAIVLKRDGFTYVDNITEEDKKQEKLGAIKIHPLKKKDGAYVHLTPEELEELENPKEDVKEKPETFTKKTSDKHRGKRGKKK